MKARTIPIIHLRGALIVSIQIELSDRLVLDLKEELAHEIVRSNPHGLVIEISGVDVVDSFIANAIRDIAHVAQLMGVSTVVAGLDAGMAITLVEMGMTMQGVRTALNLDAALQLLDKAASEMAQRDAELHDLLLAGDSDASVDELVESDEITWTD